MPWCAFRQRHLDLKSYLTPELLCFCPGSVMLTHPSTAVTNTRQGKDHKVFYNLIQNLSAYYVNGHSCEVIVLIFEW